jgi:hypothetical protein
MLVGTTYPVTIKRLGRFFVGFLGIWLANAGGSTWHAPKALAGSSPVAGPSNGFGNLSSIVVASNEDACGECRRNYMTLESPGSTPGCALSTLV